TGKDHGARVHFILTSILRCRSVRSFKDRVTGVVVDVSTRCNTYATNDGSERIGDVVAVEVQRSDDGVLIGTQQDLLQECVSDGVFDDNLMPVAFEDLPWSAVEVDCSEFFFRQRIAPVAETS